MIQLKVKKPKKQGTIIKIEQTNQNDVDKKLVGKTYKVLSCVDLNWLYNKKTAGWLLNLKEI